MATRKPMTFDIEESATKAQPIKAAEEKGRDTETRRAVGARVKVSVYRQLKAHAALAGLKVQDLVEEAIQEKLERLAAQPGQ